MARLIDANANREEFKKILCCTLNDCSITTKKKFNLIMTAFDDMPTAYDVEKVVEEVRISCCCMGFDESQTEIIVDDVRRGVVE